MNKFAIACQFRYGWDLCQSPEDYPEGIDTFDTIEAAQADRTDFLETQKQAHADGHMSEAYEPEEWAVAEIDSNNNIIKIHNKQETEKTRPITLDAAALVALQEIVDQLAEGDQAGLVLSDIILTFNQERRSEPR